MRPYNLFAAADAGRRADALGRAVREVVQRLDRRPRTAIIQPHGTHGTRVLVHAPEDVPHSATRSDQRKMVTVTAPEDVSVNGERWLEIRTASGLEGAIDLYLTREIQDENMRAITAERDQADLMRELLDVIAAQPELRVVSPRVDQVA